MPTRPIFTNRMDRIGRAQTQRENVLKVLPLIDRSNNWICWLISSNVILNIELSANVLGWTQNFNRLIDGFLIRITTLEAKWNERTALLQVICLHPFHFNWWFFYSKYWALNIKQFFSNVSYAEFLCFTYFHLDLNSKFIVTCVPFTSVRTMLCIICSTDMCTNPSKWNICSFAHCGSSENFNDCKGAASSCHNQSQLKITQMKFFRYWWFCLRIIVHFIQFKKLMSAISLNSTWKLLLRPNKCLIFMSSSEYINWHECIILY